eukprot:SAG31_NODE_962_length_10731_cov_4.198552_5_plen_52_part_00
MLIGRIMYTSYIRSLLLSTVAGVGTRCTDTPQTAPDGGIAQPGYKTTSGGY